MQTLCKVGCHPSPRQLRHWRQIEKLRKTQLEREPPTGYSNAKDSMSNDSYGHLFIHWYTKHPKTLLETEGGGGCRQVTQWYSSSRLWIQAFEELFGSPLKTKAWVPVRLVRDTKDSGKACWSNACDPIELSRVLKWVGVLWSSNLWSSKWKKKYFQNPYMEDQNPP